MHHLVIGAGPAATAAIETIRAIDGGRSAVTLVSDEPAYARMALPYLVAGEMAEEELFTLKAEAAERLGVEVRFGRRVTRLEPAEKRAVLDDGTELTYDRCLIATGSSPLPLAGTNAARGRVQSLWRLDEARALLGGKARRRAVVVGAGFVGMIVLGALARRGWHLAVVERESQVLPRMLDREAAGIVEAWLRERGVRVITATQVAEVEAVGRGKRRLRLSDGQLLEADVVIVAAGVRPNTDLVTGAGVRVGQGILVDSRCETSVTDIYAAGDVAEGPDLLGGRAVHAIQPTAIDHGRIAGANMAGHRAAYPGSLLINILDVLGLHCASIGRREENGRERTVLADPALPLYRKLLWEGGRLVGASFVGPAAETTMLCDLGMAKGLIQAAVDLHAWRSHIERRPWDLRRVYIGSGAAGRLLGRTLLDVPPLGHLLGARREPGRSQPNSRLRLLLDARPAEMDSLPPTPTPGARARHASEGGGAVQG